MIDAHLSSSTRLTRREVRRGTLQPVVAAAPTRDLDAVWGRGFMTPENFLAVIYNTT